MAGARPSARDLREQITFQTPVRASDNAGGYTQSWASIATDPTVWAKITPLTGNARLQAMQMDMTKVYEIVIRSRTDIETKLRILWGSVTMKIVDFPKPLQGGRYMKLVAEVID